MCSLRRPRAHSEQGRSMLSPNLRRESLLQWQQKRKKQQRRSTVKALPHLAFLAGYGILSKQKSFPSGEDFCLWGRLCGGGQGKKG